MKNWFRLSTLLVLLLIVITVSVLAYGLSGPLTKWVVQETAQTTTGLPVTLESASFSLFPAGIELKGLHFPDESNRQKNALEIDTIYAKLLLGPLFRGNVIIEQASVTGIKLDQNRSDPWQPIATPDTNSLNNTGSAENASDNSSDKFKQLSSSAIKTADNILQEQSANLITRQKAAELTQQIRQSQKILEIQFQKSPEQADLSELQNKLNKLLSAKIKTLDDINGQKAAWKVIQSDLAQILKDIQDIQLESAKQSNLLNQKLEVLKSAPQQDLQRLTAQYKPGNQENTAQMAGQIFGDKYYSYVLTGLQWYEKLKPWLPEASEAISEEEPVESQKIWHFPTDKPEPGFWLQQANLSIELDSAAIEISMQDWSSDYKQLNRPASIIFHRNLGQELLEGRFDVIPAYQTLVVTWSNMQLENQQLLASDSMSVLLSNAVTNMTVSARVENSNLEARSHLAFTQAKWHVTGTDSFSKALNSSLKGVNQFSVDVIGQGKILSPGLSIDSDLDSQLGNFWKAELNRKWQQTQKDLSVQLQNLVNSQNQDYQQYATQKSGEDSQLNKQLNSVQSMLNGGMDKKLDTASSEHQKRIEADRKNAEQKSKALLEKEAKKLAEDLKTKLKIPGL